MSQEQAELLTALIEAGVNINASSSKGETALHIACKKGNSKVTKLLLQNGADVLAVDHKGNAPIHVACGSRTLECLNLLLSHHACNPNQQNAVGDTPLHILCSHDWNCDMSMLRTLLSAQGIYIECTNHAGQIPAELAKSNYFVIEEISKYLNQANTHLETYVKIFVVGNPDGGKSTLIKAVTTEQSNSIFKAKHVNPSEVPPHTAGIVPLRCNSKHFGHAVLYDFAGQHEYYSSHAAVMENLVLPSPPLFLLLIDISKPMEEIKEELVYWWMFINNHSKRAMAPPHVILVGSHKDIVKKRRVNVQKTMEQITDIVRDIPVSFQFDHSKAFPLDCRKLVSRGLTALLAQLKLTCQTLRQTADIDLHCHILKVFLTTSFHSSVACEVSEIAERTKSKDVLLPQEPSQLIPLLSTLSDKGHILLLQNHTDVSKSWVVLKPELLLTEVNGSIFAPDNFKEHCSGFAMSTGVVALSKIIEKFGEPNNHVIIRYLTHLEFCFQIKDQHTLEMITKDATLQLIAQGSEHTEEYYFFPALIQNENPSDVCQPQETIKYECGWFYRCNEPTEQLTTRFLHVLILRLAFSCDPPDEPTERESVVLLRSCSVWKHGIAWWTNDGIETIVEVGLQCRWVAVMLRCPDTHKVQCAELRTKVISTVLKTKQDFCPAIGMKEFLIAPSSLQYPFEGRELTLYSMKEIAKVIIACKEFPKDTEGKNTIHISQLLPFEPFLNFGEDLIYNLFTPDQSRESEISQHNMFQIANKCYKMLDDFKEALQPNPTAFQRECVKPDCTEVDRCVALFQIIQRRGCKTWRDFEEEFSRFSIFCGRNPISSEIVGRKIFSTIHNLQRKTLIQIPHGSRLIAAQALQKSLDRIIATPSDLAAWRHLLCMAYLGLNIPPHCQVRKKSLTFKVNANLRRFLDVLNGEDLAAVEEIHPSVIKEVSIPKDAKKGLAGKIAEKISVGDVRGAVRLASSDSTFIPPNPGTLEILRQKHPPKSHLSPSSSLSSFSTSTQIYAVESEVLKAINSFPGGSGGGLDGLRPQHLKDLVGSGKQEHEVNLLKSLTIFVNLVLNGGVPDDIRPIFFGASLCALQKKDGGVHSIAIGSTLRRLVSKIAVNRCRHKCSTLLLPNQLGFGVRMGAEAAIHTARSFIRNHQTNSVLLKVDITNAFNSIHRNKVLEAVSKHIPSLFKYVHSSYAVSSFLAFGSDLIYSEEGVQQGDPLGPLLFCLTIHPIISHLSSPLNRWYLDNGTLGGSPTKVLADFKFIQSEGIKYGLQVNPGKCEVVALSDSSSTTSFEHVQQVSVADLTLLGAPLGERAMTAILEKKISELASIEDRLSWMSAHHVFFLLKNWFALSKLSYVVRTSPCFNHPLLQSFDHLQMNLLQRLLNIKLDDRAELQASLPIYFGGLGVVSATRVASSAYISSKLSCVRLEYSLLALDPSSPAEPSVASEFDSAITCWKTSSGLDHFPSSMRQCDWSSPVFEKAQTSLISSAVDMQDKARLLAVAEKEAGAWLEALPVPSLGLHLSSDELRIVISLRLGVPTCSEYTCICNEKVGVLGTHGLQCKMSKDQLSRHHLVNDILTRALTMANVPAMLGTAGIVSEDNKQPDGMSNVPWSQGRHLIWDFTCPDTLAPSHLPATSVEVGSAAKAAQERKMVKYQSVAADHIFVPITIETLGPMGPEAKRFLQELGRRLNNHTGKSNSASFLRQQISMAIQKGNALAMMGSMPG